MWLRNATHNISSISEPIPNTNFGVVYGSGIAVAIVSYEQTKLGNITIDRQVVRVVNSTTNAGDGIDSDIFGLGYPALTWLHPGANLSNDPFLLTWINYNPLNLNVYQQGFIEPLTSMTLERLTKNATNHT